jgi:hypothetical protein
LIKSDYSFILGHVNTHFLCGKLQVNVSREIIGLERKRERWNIAEKRVGIARKFYCETVSTLSTCPWKTLLRELATKS